VFFDVFLSVATRARKLVKAVEAEEKLPVDLLEWRFLIPPLHVYRALMVNRSLEDATGWAGRAINEDEAGRHDEALESLKRANEHLAEVRWFRSASDEEVNGRLARHYSWVLLGGRPVYPV
jgi:hypothetical protein